MRILVNGLMAYNSGKTSLVEALLLRARETGQTVLPFKPRSGHNFWEHYDHSRACEALGLLVSRDILQLHGALEDPPPLTLMNPHHQLHCPMDPLPGAATKDPPAPTPDLILAERLSDPEDGTTLFVHRQANRAIAPSAYLKALEASATRVQRFEEPPLQEDLTRLTTALERAYRALLQRTPHLLIESFSDVAWPLALPLAGIDRVVTVGGSRGFVFAPADVYQAVEALRESRMASLLPYLKARHSFVLPLLTSAERADPTRLVQGYQEALKVVWSEGGHQGF